MLLDEWFRNSSREESTLSDISEIPQRDRRAEQTEREKRSAPERVGKVKYLNYPSFIQKSEEERIFKTCGNIASTYAQRMAKILFAKTIHLYFKVFRFPLLNRKNYRIKSEAKENGSTRQLITDSRRQTSTAMPRNGRTARTRSTKICETFRRTRRRRSSKSVGEIL